MARINIEDSIWKDDRFQDLIVKAGDRLRAKGMILEIWTLAQEYWFPEKKLIPLERVERAGLGAVIEVGLAEARPDGVFAVGTTNAFDWLFQRQKAGEQSGKARAKPAKKTKRKATDVNDRSTSVNGSEHPRTSISTSFSSSISSSDSKSSSSSDSEKTLYSVGDGASLVIDSDHIRSPIGFFIANYVNAYQVRYGTAARPALSGKVQGQIKRFLVDTPLERACQLVQTYMQMNDPWFITKAHDFGTFIENLSKVGLKLDTGQSLTRGEIQQIDRKQTNFNAFSGLLAEAEQQESGNA